MRLARLMKLANWLSLALLLWTPFSVHALEAALTVALEGTAYAGSVAAIATAIEVVVFAATTYYGMDQRRKAENQARDAYNASLKDRTITRIATEAPFRYVYGRARVGSDIVAIFTGGDRDQYKYLVCVHAAHPCQSVDAVYIAGKQVFLDANGFATSNQQTDTFNAQSGTSVTLTNAPNTNSVSLRYSYNTNQFDPTQSGPLTVSSISGNTVNFSNAGLTAPYNVFATYTTQALAGNYYDVGQTTVNTDKFSGVTANHVSLTAVPAGSVTLRYSYNNDPNDPLSSGNLNVTSISGTTVNYDASNLSGSWFVYASYQTSGANSHLRVVTHLGQIGDPADAMLQSEIGSAWWDNNAKLAGLTYSVVKLDLTQADFQTGIPSIEVVLKGKPVYDFRTRNSTKTTAWSDNPVLALYDYLTGEVCGVSASALPLTLWDTAANVCDELLAWPDGTSQPRYRINGALTSDEDKTTVLNRFAQCMAGVLVGNTWEVYAGKYVAPVLDLLESDIVGDISITGGVSDADIFNGVKGQFISSENAWVATDYTPYQNTTYVTADGAEKWASVDFPFTDSNQRVRNLCRVMTEDQRLGQTVVAQFSMKAWPAKVGMRVTLTSATFGFSQKVFRVMARKYAPNAAIELTLKADDPSVWDNVDAATVDAVAPTLLANPYAIAPLASLSCTSSDTDLLLLADGSVVSRIHVTWPAATTGTVVHGGYIEVQYMRNTTGIWNTVRVTGDATDVYLSPVVEGNVYFVRARCVNPSFNVQSSWVTTTHTVIGKTMPPPSVTGFAVTLSPDDRRTFAFNTSNQPVDVSSGGGYRIKYRTSGSNTAWASMTALHNGLLKQSPYETGNPGSGTYDFAIVAVSCVGIESSNPQFISNVVLGNSPTKTVYTADITAAAVTNTTAGSSAAESNVATSISQQTNQNAIFMSLSVNKAQPDSTLEITINANIAFNTTQSGVGWQYVKVSVFSGFTTQVGSAVFDATTLAKLYNSGNQVYYPLSLTVTDTPGAGTTTYSIVVSYAMSGTFGAGNIWLKNQTMTIKELKR